jgi:uncharacterized membrane protein (UPF0127 family)
MLAVSIGIKGGEVLADKAWATEDVSERVQGWMKKTQNEPGDGLLITPGSAVHTFGMKMAIDVVFLDSSFTVTKLRQHMAPNRMAFGPFLNMLMPWRSQILELPAGVAAKVRVGDVIEMIRRKA